MESLTVRITGKSPLMMHAATLANPLLEVTKAHKEMTNKRQKTDVDHLEIARSEFLAGLYWDETDRVHIPGICIDMTLQNGAKLQKKGTAWKQGAMVLEDRCVLDYDGPRTPAELWANPTFVDVRGVKVGKAKIMRYRPLFLRWATTFTVSINTDVLNVKEAKKAIEDAGAIIGLCECRPRFGRFEVAYV